MTPTPANPLAKLLSVVAGVIVLILGFMFSLVLLGVVLVAGLGIWAWFWWKTRKLRREIEARMREAGARSAPFPTDGSVIEGEAVVVGEMTTTPALENRSSASPDRRSPE